MRIWSVCLLVAAAGCSGVDFSAELLEARSRNADLDARVDELRARNGYMKDALARAEKRIKNLAEAEADASKVLPLAPGDEDFIEVQGNLARLSSVIFASGRYQITDQRALAALDRWAARLSQSDIALITIEGHTDSDPIRHAKSRGVRNNVHLSALRAAAVANRLINAGVSESKVVVMGIGHRRPAHATDKSRNRRVEMRIYTSNSRTAAAGRVPPPK